AGASPPVRTANLEGSPRVSSAGKPRSARTQFSLGRRLSLSPRPTRLGHIVDSDRYEFALSEEAVVYGAPCRSQAGSDDLALRLPRRGPGDQRIRIGLVHGRTFDIAGHHTNFPIALDDAQQQGLSYLASGD